ncbi:MAG: DUF3187 family protein [Halieaceae bacterium]|nr:DUF3187 family protein [Halieaceae bacterium]
MRLTIIPAFCLALSVGPALADPLYAKNLAPLAGLFGFPNLRNAQTLGAGEFSGAIHGNVANNYSVDANASEFVNFDVETRRFALRGAVGLGWGIDFEAELPWLRHEGGDLDQLIENWHEFWNLPDGDRDEVPRDLIDIRFNTPDAAFALQEEVEGWGDLNLALTKQLWSSETAAFSLRAGAKLGTGDEDELLGSGSEDYYLSFNASGEHRGDWPITWHGQVGYLRAGDADVLGDIQEQDLWFASGGMEWRTWQSVHLKLQIDSHAEVADSSLTQLGDASVQITAGANWLFARGWEAEFSFSEDIAVDTSPDFVLQFGLRYRLPGGRGIPD